MQKFIFSGDWETKIHLPIVSEYLDNPELTSSWAIDDQKNGFFQMVIADGDSDSPDPTEAQMATISFIQTHQQAILEALLAYHTSILNPYHEVEQGYSREEYPEYYPPLNHVGDLKNVFGLNTVNIGTFEKEGMAYYDLHLSWLLDQEHGLDVSMHGSRIIESGGTGDVSGEKIYEDAGIDKKQFTEEYNRNYAERERNKHLHIMEHGIYTPNPKYGKIKTWQDEANQHHPFWLIHYDRFDEFKDFFQNKANAAYCPVENALSISIFHKKPQFVDFLLQYQPQSVYSSIHYAIDNNDFMLIKKLMAFEKDINKERGQEAYLNKLMTRYYTDYDDADKRAFYENTIAYFMEQGANPYLQERWGRDAFFCFKNMENETKRTEIDTFVKDLCQKHGYQPNIDKPANEDPMAILRRMMDDYEE